MHATIYLYYESLSELDFPLLMLTGYSCSSSRTDGCWHKDISCYNNVGILTSQSTRDTENNTILGTRTHTSAFDCSFYAVALRESFSRKSRLHWVIHVLKRWSLWWPPFHCIFLSAHYRRISRCGYPIRQQSAGPRSRHCWPPNSIALALAASGSRSHRLRPQWDV